MTLLAAVPYHTFPDFQVGPVTIRTFGLLVALGIVVGAAVGARYVGARGIDPDEYTNLATKVAIVGLVGARLTWVLSHLEAIETPLDVIAVWEGGVQFSGGLLFGTVAGWWWSRERWRRRERWVLLDGTAIGLTVGLAIGRLGCMAVGEHFGGPTDFFLGMTYRGGGTVEPEPAIGETIHNTAFYEFLHLLVLLAVLAVLLRRAGDRRRPLVPGTIAGVFLVWYGVGRFVTDLARTYDARALGLTGAQWACLVLVVLGSWLLATGARRAESLAAEDAAEEVPEDATRPRPSTIKVLSSDQAESRVDELGGVDPTPGHDEVPTRTTDPGSPRSVPAADAHVTLLEDPKEDPDADAAAGSGPDAGEDADREDADEDAHGTADDEVAVDPDSTAADADSRPTPGDGG